MFGGPGEVRTLDLMTASHARSQLRHRPTWGSPLFLTCGRVAVNERASPVVSEFEFSTAARRGAAAKCGPWHEPSGKVSERAQAPTGETESWCANSQGFPPLPDLTTSSLTAVRQMAPWATLCRARCPERCQHLR